MLRIAGIVPSSIVDGPGFRYTIFLQGCNHCCEYCHNKNTWDSIGGTLMDIPDIITDIQKEYYIDGVTISGGEPLEQAFELAKLLCELKNLGYHIILFSGYTFEEIIRNSEMSKCLYYIDVLIDGKYIHSKRSLKLRFRGSSNQRVIDIPLSLRAKTPIIIYWDE